MDAEKKHLRDEVAELSEAVRALRDELVITRAAHHCHGCHWPVPVWTYYPPPPGLPYQPVTIGAAGSGINPGYYTQAKTSVAAGGSTTYVLSQGN